jgi:hypothetical protein
MMGLPRVSSRLHCSTLASELLPLAAHGGAQPMGAVGVKFCHHLPSVFGNLLFKVLDDPV